jgi:hypothetical protein
VYNTPPPPDFPSPTVAFLNPMSKWRVGSNLPLRFEAIVSSATDSAQRAALQYEWSLAPANAVAGTDVTVDDTAAYITLNPAVLSAGSYIILLIVTDTLPAHLSSQSPEPSSSLTWSFEVLPSLDVVVEVATSQVDPCAGSTLCKYGGVCQSTLDTASSATSSNTYSLSCICPSFPISFYALDCSFAILTLAGGVASYTEGGDVRIYGLGLEYLFALSVATTSVNWNIQPANASSSFEAENVIALYEPIYGEGSVHLVTFHAPPLILRNSTHNSSSFEALDFWRSLMQDGITLTGNVDLINSYQVLTLNSTLPSSSSTNVVLQLPNVIFYAASQCLDVGEFVEDGYGGCKSW